VSRTLCARRSPVLTVPDPKKSERAICPVGAKSKAAVSWLFPISFFPDSKEHPFFVFLVFPLLLTLSVDFSERARALFFLPLIGRVHSLSLGEFFVLTMGLKLLEKLVEKWFVSHFLNSEALSASGFVGRGEHGEEFCRLLRFSPLPVDLRMKSVLEIAGRCSFHNAHSSSSNFL